MAALADFGALVCPLPLASEKFFTAAFSSLAICPSWRASAFALCRTGAGHHGFQQFHAFFSSSTLSLAR